MSDVCLILEGTYPYVTGGVASWTHDLICAQKDLTFHLITILASGADLTKRYQVPSNVTGQSVVYVQNLLRGERCGRRHRALLNSLEEPLASLQKSGGLEDLREILDRIAPFRKGLGADVLLNSPAAWDLLVRMYRKTHSQSSFLEYFWGWRALLGGLYSMLLCELPEAGVYHSLCTGYAGLLAARAHVETGRPAILTEHGIYTNERRIEIAMSDWLHSQLTPELSIEKPHADINDLWIQTFLSYSRVAYQASNPIVTLYEGNQEMQVADGADPARLAVIPNAIECGAPVSLPRRRGNRPPAIALIGRVVPIKDIKTFLRAAVILRDAVPDVRVRILGPTDEDPDYFEECEALVSYLGLGDCVEFTGRVRLSDHLDQIDVLVLTSISEAQPLVILEAGACGIPSVATDVGACREMILGGREDPPLGPGGAVIPLSNPAAVAHEVTHLLRDRDYYDHCSAAMYARVRRYYDKAVLDRSYRSLYDGLLRPRVKAAA